MDTQNSNAQLQFEVEKYREGEKTITTFSDRFKLSVFNEDFIQKEQDYKDAQKQEQKLVLRKVMYGQEKAYVNTYFEAVMRAEATSIIRADYEPSRQEEIQWLSAASYGILGMFFAAIFLWLMARRKKQG